MKTLQHFIITLIISLPIIGMSQIDEKQIMEETKEVFTFNVAPTLLMGTWHMGATSDAQTSSYDASLSDRIEEVDQLAKQIALFKPTKIFVEITPQNQKKMEEHYPAYLKNPDSLSTYNGEVGLLAFQIARLTGAKLVATDHKLGHDYGSISKLAQETENKDYFSYVQQVGPFLQKVESLEKQATTKQLYRFTNTTQYLEVLFNINADLMTYVNTDGKFEGADVATNYYRRNIRILANFNRTAISTEDKVLVLYGASHVAFFHDFMKRSHKYNLKDIQKFLK
jgi:hypothetical protein